MADCSQCQYLRARRSPTSALKADLGMVTPSVGEAFNRICAKERRDLEREDLEATEAMRNGCLLFQIKPKVLEYCSYEGKAYVPAVKNNLIQRAGCETWRRREMQTPRRCDDCRHRMRPTGDMTAAGVRFMEGYLGMKVSAHDPMALKPFEFELAYDTNGELPGSEPPAFLSWCSKHSQAGRGPYSICAIRNIDGRCEDWAGQTSEAFGQESGNEQGRAGRVEDIVLTRDDNWRWCGQEQYQFSGSSLYVKWRAQEAGRMKTRVYRLADAPQNVPFALLDEGRREQRVLVRWRPQNVAIRSGVDPPRGIYQLRPYEQIKKKLHLVEGRAQTASHPNADLSYRAYLYSGMLHIDGGAEPYVLTLSRLPAGKWVRPRERRFGQPLPLRVRVPTFCSFFEPHVLIEGTTVGALLNWFPVSGAIELEWIDD